MKPTVLFVTEVKPYPAYGGLYILTYNALASLSDHFNVIVLAPEVTVDCPLRQQISRWYTLPGYATDLREKGNNGRFLIQPRPIWQQQLQKILATHRPHVVWFNYGHWGQYVPLVHAAGARAVMHTHNIQSAITRQRAATTPWGLLYLLTWLRTAVEKYHERHLFQNFDRVISLTEIDRRYHAQFVGDERSILIPGYLDERPYQHGQHVEREKDLLSLTGSFDSFQNSQGALWFMQEIWPQLHAACPTVRIQLVGKGAAQLPVSACADRGVEVIDSVPDIVLYLRRATVAVVPILHGSGIRFKILEALACELPVVSTTLGAQGIAIHHGESIMLADNAAAFTQAILTLLHNHAKRVQMAQQGLAVWRQHYTASVNTASICVLVENLTCQLTTEA